MAVSRDYCSMTVSSDEQCSSIENGVVNLYTFHTPVESIKALSLWIEKKIYILKNII